MKRLLYLSALLLGLTAGYSPADALQMTFFGEDAGLGESTRLSSHPNSDAARDGFFSYLSGVGTENFEGFPTGTVTPLAVNFGYATATLGGSGFIATVLSGTNNYGRYPISGNNYWDTSEDFTLTFNAPQSAFGFYGIDIGDFWGQLNVTAIGGSSTNYAIPHTVEGNGGSVLYWGFIDTDNPFTSIAFSTNSGGRDVFGFDDFTIGTRDQINPEPVAGNVVPEPSTLILLTAGLTAITLAGMRRKA